MLASLFCEESLEAIQPPGSYEISLYCAGEAPRWLLRGSLPVESPVVELLNYLLRARPLLEVP